MKNIGIVFLVLVLIQTGSWFYFDGKIESKSEELDKKREVLTTLVTLEDRWSKKVQAQELKRVYDFLAAFDIYHTTKERKKRKVLTMDLKTENLNKIVSFVLNKNINYKQFTIIKIDKYNIKFSVEM